METVPAVPSGKSFHDIRRNRVGRTAHLAAQLKSFVGWKCFQRKLIQRHEIVRALPGDQRVMTDDIVRRRSIKRDAIAHSACLPHLTCPTYLTHVTYSVHTSTC